jgi:hypothetical protein
MENGKFTEKTEGSPQGNVMSPVLANVYLHYVLDTWFEETVKKSCKGEAYMIRYADDSVWAFQYKKDAVRFLKALIKRLAKHSLEVAESKTRLLDFGRFAKQDRAERGLRKPETFSFLGFTFCCGKVKPSKKGDALAEPGSDMEPENPKTLKKPKTSRMRKKHKRWKKQTGQGEKYNLLTITDSKRIPGKLRKLREWLESHRHDPVSEIMKGVNRTLLGHFNYYGVETNVKQLKTFRWQVEKILFKVLNRRSQRRSYDWEKFRKRILERFPLPEAKVYTSI